MASFIQLSSGNWRVQVRRKGRYLAQTFRRKKDAESWDLEAERSIDRGREPRAKSTLKVKTFGDLIDLHKADMREVKRPLRRSKSYSLNLLDRKLGRIPFRSLGREQLIAYGRDRAHEGAGPVTLGAELSYTGTILGHAAAVHGIDVSREDVDLARIALRRLGLIGRGTERDRRPTQQELDDLIAFFDGNSRQLIPVGRIIRFAVASAMRVSEISNILWSDIDTRLRIVIVRDRKDPRRKDGNHQRVPLISLTGYDAWSILQEQRLLVASNDRIFPYNDRSIGTAFRRACKDLGIMDLHFHDLRHEATSRLFESGLTIEKVALVTGHRDWKMLRRYTHLKPESLTVGAA